MRPFNRSLHPDDYGFLEPYVNPIRVFLAQMSAAGVPHREYHPHRFWEYGSVMQQLEALNIPESAEIVDIGAGASFFDPYCTQKFHKLCCTDTEKYGDHSWMVERQREFANVAMPLFADPVERMPDGWSSVFDVVMCISTIEHVDDHDAAFGELVRITKPGGYVFITSDYFRDLEQFEQSISRHLQVTPYRKEYVLDLPNRFAVDFVGPTDFDYRGDFVHNYSFCNVCLRKRLPASTGGTLPPDNGKG
jgi:SAM-dependent methyltransferase